MLPVRLRKHLLGSQLREIRRALRCRWLLFRLIPLRRVLPTEDVADLLCDGSLPRLFRWVFGGSAAALARRRARLRRRLCGTRRRALRRSAVRRTWFSISAARCPFAWEGC